MSEEMTQRRLATFTSGYGRTPEERQHQQAVVSLAAHAALPVVLDADLLHLLRLNFLPHLSYTAEAYVLLSPLCSEIGGGLYAMSPPMRTVLLHKLVEESGATRLGEIATLLWKYSRERAPWVGEEGLEKAQELTVLNLLDPPAARAWLEVAEVHAAAGATSVPPSWYVAMRQELAYGEQYDMAIAHHLLSGVLQGGADPEAGLAALAEARRRFTHLAEAGNATAARMAAVCLTASGDCLRDLGRLEEAATAYEETIRLDEQRGDPRDVAATKGQLGTVRLLQGDYPAALAAHTAARDTFAQLSEPGSVAVAWHQMGRVHQEAGHYAAAELAYHESLRLNTQLGHTAGRADTLDQLGSLYAAMQRLEDAVRFALQAAALYASLHDLAGEGRARHNAASDLIALRHYDAARWEVQRAIVCKEPFGHAAEPWTTFHLLHDLEHAEGHLAAAAAAHQRAQDAYLAYRRAGGVSQSRLAPLYTLVAQALTAHDTAEAAATLAALGQRPDLPASIPTVLSALQALLAGARDPALADDPALDYDDAAELRLLLDQLGAADGTAPGV